jgi:hypothetical protein
MTIPPANYQINISKKNLEDSSNQPHNFAKEPKLCHEKICQQNLISISQNLWPVGMQKMIEE